jgi:hypothetical protein
VACASWRNRIGDKKLADGSCVSALDSKRPAHTIPRPLGACSSWTFRHGGDLLLLLLVLVLVLLHGL